MSREEVDNEPRKSKYLFKLAMVGPDDNLLEQVLEHLVEHVIAVDGIRIGATELELDTSDVRAIVMSPRHTALDILLSMTYKGATGALIILPRADPKIESKYRDEVRENIGPRFPTRTFIAGDCIDDLKCIELVNLFDDIVEEMLAQREKKNAK